MPLSKKHIEKLREQGPKNRRRGKRVQRKVKKKLISLAAENVAALGGEDLRTDKFSIEVKGRVSFVGEGWVKQAEANCPEGKTPLVIVHVFGEEYKDSIVMIRLKNWLSKEGGKINNE